MRHAIFGIFVCFGLIGSGFAQTSPAPAESSTQTQSGSEIEKAIDEFRVVTGELGLRADGPKRRQAQAGPRPEWHGRIFYNLRNDFFDAIPHEIVQNGGDKRPLRRNQYGFNISGPVYLPWLYNGGRRTFFSLSYEGMRESIGRSFLQTVATERERAGDWSQTVDKAGKPLPIYDPATTRPNPEFDRSQPISAANPEYLRDLFPNGQIPISRQDPIARRALEYYPLPNSARGPFFRNNFFIVSKETNNADGIIAKVDHTLMDRHRLSVDVSYSDGLNLSPRRIDSPANPGGVDYTAGSREATLTHIFTLSPRTVNEARFSVDSRTYVTQLQEADFSVPGAASDAFPYFEFQNYVDFGRRFPDYSNARHQYEWRDSLSHTWGEHNLRFSGQYERDQVNTFRPRYPAGIYRFTANQTALPGVNNTGHEFASFLLGRADYGELTEIPSPSYFRNSYLGASIFDNYEIRQGLQVSFGTRLSWRTPRTEKYNRQSTVDLSVPNAESAAPGALIFANRDGVGSAFRPLSFVLEPRFSVSWSPERWSGTVVRSSWSRSYRSIPMYYGHWGTQGFTGTRTYISENPQLQPAVVLGAGLPPPEHPLPDLRPEAANDTFADLIPRDHRLPYFDFYQFSVERQLPYQLQVRMVAGRTHGRDMLLGNESVNWNAIPIDALKFRDALNDEDFNRSVRPYPQFRGFDVYDSYPGGWFNEDYGYATFEKRASSGLTLSGQYRFSKEMDDYSSGAQDFYNLKNERALSTSHRPHRFSVSYSYDIPGARVPFAPSWTKTVSQGWTISGSTQWYSGDPVRLRPLFNNTGRAIQYLRVNAVPGVDPTVAEQGPTLWFNPEAFDQPPDFTIGNLSRTHPHLLNPSYQNHDLSVRRRFPISADRSIELTAVGLNFLNTANWNDPDSEIGSDQTPNVNAGKIIGSTGGRIIQVGLRINF